MANGIMGNAPQDMAGGVSEPTPSQGAGGQPASTNKDDAVLNMHMTADVKQALQNKGINIESVQSYGPQEPVIVIPVSIITAKYPAETPQDSMKQFVQDMMPQQNMAEAQQVSEPTQATEVPPQDGGGMMNRRPVTV